MKRVISLLVVAALLCTMIGCGESSESKNGKSNNKQSQYVGAEYEKRIFDNSYVHTIDVQIAEEDWEDLCENPLQKTKYEVNVTIDGEKFEQVSFATKGNTSLSSVASDADSDRYSFKINFGKFVDGQTYYGLDKLNLNNLYADATYMKDYLSYEIFRQAGVYAPLTSYVSLSVNGEEFGLYIAIEEVGESYLARTGSDGELYKPETSMLANMGGGGDFPQMPEGMGGGEMPQMPEGMEGGEFPQMPEGMEGGEFPQMPEWMKNGRGDREDGDSARENQANRDNRGGRGGFGESGDNGASLQYTDDNLESYSDIFDNAETDVDEEDMERVVMALKGLAEEDAKDTIEQVVDTDEVIRYFVAHNFVINYDSYTGNMLHNYYLLEEDGKLSMLPWDYNLAFGAFTGGGGNQMFGNFMQSASGVKGEVAGQAGGNIQSDKGAIGEGFTMGGNDVTGIVNWGIDSPLSGATEESRPMWNWIVSDEKYLEKYHEIYDELIENYFESGEFEKEITRVYEMIKPYVEKDTSAFYTVEEFETAYETLKDFCLLRSESIRLQLEGKLATVSNEQKTEVQVDASAININAMGRQNMGR